MSTLESVQKEKVELERHIRYLEASIAQHQQEERDLDSWIPKLHRELDQILNEKYAARDEMFRPTDLAKKRTEIVSVEQKARNAAALVTQQQRQLSQARRDWRDLCLELADLRVTGRPS